MQVIKKSSSSADFYIKEGDTIESPVILHGKYCQ